MTFFFRFRVFAPKFTLFFGTFCFLGAIHAFAQNPKEPANVQIKILNQGKLTPTGWETWSEWIWTAPYESSLVGTPKLRVRAFIPNQYQLSNQDSEIHIADESLISNFKNQSEKLTVIDFPFYQNSYLLDARLNGKKVQLQFNIKVKEKYLHGIIHDDCIELGVDSKLIKRNAFLKDKLIAITCRQNKNWVDISIQHPSKNRLDVIETEYQIKSHPNWSQIRTQIKDEILPMDGKVATVHLRQKGKTHHNAYLISGDNHIFPRFQIFTSLYSSYLSYQETFTNADMYQISLLGSLSTKYHLVLNQFFLRASVYTTLFPIFHGPASQSKIREYGLDFHLGSYLFHLSDQSKLNTYLGLRVDGMNVEDGNWGFDVLLGPELKFEIILLSHENNTVSILPSLFLLKNNSAKFGFSNREIALELRYKLDTHEKMFQHVQLFTKYKNTRFTLLDLSRSMTRNEISFGIISQL